MKLMTRFLLYNISHVLSDDENKQIYGKCNHINGHGHNYIGMLS